MAPTQIQLRRDTAANWSSENPILAEGEIGIVTAGLGPRLKVGDGTTAWNDLPYSAMLIDPNLMSTFGNGHALRYREDDNWLEDAGIAGNVNMESSGNENEIMIRGIQPEGIKASGVLLSDFASLAYNYLINGGFDFAQRQTPGTLTTIADNKYSADRWRVTRENADVQYQRVDATGETGLTSKFYGAFKKITNAGKIHICQILEGINSVALRSKTVTFRVQMKASASKTIRMAILELQNAGTIDTIPATLVTAFGADGADPTLGSNVAVITAAQSKSVTTSWQKFSVSVTVPSNSKNLICAVWSDADFAANDILSLAEAELHIGSMEQSWNPRLIEEELALVQRYYCKSHAIDEAPADDVGTNRMAGFAWQTTSIDVQDIPFPVRMRTTAPTIAFYKPNGVGSGSTWAWYLPSGGAYQNSSSVIAVTSNDRSFIPEMTVTGAVATAGYIVRGGWAADAEL